MADRLHRSPTARRRHRRRPGLGRHRGDVVNRLAQQPRNAVCFVLGTLRDPRRAWQLAHDLDLDPDDTHTWGTLATAYEAIDPPATFPVHARIVERDLTHADARRYRDAARRLAGMRTLAAGTGDQEHIDHVDQLIADLRLTHRRRPRLQQEFDRADVP